MPDTFNKAVHDDIVWNFLTFKVFFHNLIIGFDSRFHHLAVSIGDPVLQFIRDFDFIGSIAVAAVGLLIEDVDDTTEILFLAQRQMERQNPFTNLGPEVIHDLIKVSIFTVHLINENQSRQSGFFCEIPALFRSNLDPARCTDHYEHTVNGAESALYFSYEISKSRGIKEVDLDIVPFNRRKGRTDRNTALDFLWLKVRCCLSILHFAHPADGAAAIKQGFRKGSRPCTAVPYNSNVPDFITCVLFHVIAPFISNLFVTISWYPFSLISWNFPSFLA